MGYTGHSDLGLSASNMMTLDKSFIITVIYKLKKITVFIILYSSVSNSTEFQLIFPDFHVSLHIFHNCAAVHSSAHDDG